MDVVMAPPELRGLVILVDLTIKLTTNKSGINLNGSFEFQQVAEELEREEER